MSLCPWCKKPMRMDPSGLLGDCVKCSRHLRINNGDAEIYTNGDGSICYPPVDEDINKTIEKIEQEIEQWKNKK